MSGWRWIRTTVGVSQQIYSLPHLATLVSTRACDCKVTTIIRNLQIIEIFLYFVKKHS